MFEKTQIMDLFIFDGEGTGEGGADGGAADAAGQVAADNNAVGAENATAEEGTAEDLDAEFDEIIKGKYKDQFERKFKTLSERRFRGQRQMKSELEAYRKTMDRIMPRYEAKTLDELNAKLDNDDNYIRVKAAEKGMSEDTCREYLAMEERLFESDRRDRERAKSEQIEAWMREAEEMRQIYPDFDLETEFNRSEDFFNRVNSGQPMLEAYRSVYFDDLLNSALKAGMREASAKTVESIRSQKQRPSENGTGHGSPGKSGKNIMALTRAECDELEKRVARGERVTLT